MSSAKSSSARRRRQCPQCHCGLRRARRSGVEHLRAWFQPSRRRLGQYRCIAAGCGWSGLLPRGRVELEPMTPSTQLSRGLAGAALLSLASLGIGAAVHLLRPPLEMVQIGPRQVARGYAHDGDRLPSDHPLILASSPIGETDEAGPPEPPRLVADENPEAESKLQLRRHCSWGVPGRNPYKGSVELALRTAKLDESVVRRIADDVRARKSIDRLSITNGSIRADGSGRRFDPTHVAMTYGRTLCTDTRVNFKKNHVERADLYEAADAKGNIVAVMVPDACGNVSVLSEVADADDLAAAAAARKEGRAVDLRRMPQQLTYDEGDGGGNRRAAARQNVNGVPLPGSLALVLSGLAALAWAARRRWSLAPR